MHARSSPRRPIGRREDRSAFGDFWKSENEEFDPSRIWRKVRAQIWAPFSRLLEVREIRSGPPALNFQLSPDAAYFVEIRARMLEHQFLSGPK